MQLSSKALLSPGQSVTVRAIKRPRRTDVVYTATCVSDDGDHIVLHAIRTLPTVSIGPTSFETGDIFEEHYWRTRWYGIFKVINAEGVLKGWYGNISLPAEVVKSEVRSRDLELDLWIPADGSAPVKLDEDEFLASGLLIREPHVAEGALRGLLELEELVRSGGLSYLAAHLPAALPPLS